MIPTNPIIPNRWINKLWIKRDSALDGILNSASWAVGKSPWTVNIVELKYRGVDRIETIESNLILFCDNYIISDQSVGEYRRKEY